MNDLSTEVKRKKLNIFQKVRLYLFNKQKFNIKKYANAPDYIKRDDVAIYKIIDNPKYQTEDILLFIPKEKLQQLLEEEYSLITKFSYDKQIEFILQNPKLVKNYYYFNENDLFYLFDYAISNGNIDFCQSLKHIPNQQAQYLTYLKNNNQLENTLPIVLKFMDDDIIEKVLSFKINLIHSLDNRQQISYAIKHPDSFCHLDSNLQMDYINDNPEFIIHANDSVQEKFTLQDKNNLSKTSKDFQLRTIQKHPNAYNYASDMVKSEIFENVKDPMCILTLKSLLYNDILNSKHINISELSNHYTSSYNPIIDLFKDIHLESSETITNMFLYSRLMGAKGKLISSNTVLHGCLGEDSTTGVDDYTTEQVQIVQSLNPVQIQELIKIDSNYILPYLTGSNIQTISLDEITASKTRCKQLFVNMFGKEKFNSLESCIDLVYSLQLNEQDSLKESTPTTSQLGNYHKSGMKKLNTVEKIPLNHMKLLFNKNIINSNSFDSIKQYFEKLQKGEDTSEIFKLLMVKAYGEHAKDILDSRPGLNIHTINSLESFDGRIIDNFGLGFTHDLISYNIRDFSAFLSVIKDDKKLEIFKTYYEILSKIMGSNVETMQKAISEFQYNEKLLENVEEADLTDNQYENLISVLCSKENIYDIHTLENLDNYTEIANSKTAEALYKAFEQYKSKVSKYSEAYAVIPIKECICKHFLGLEYGHDYKSKNYGDNFGYLVSLYDLQSEKSKSDLYSDSELKILEVLDFLDKEIDAKKLMEFSNELMSQAVARNPIAIYSSIEKMKKHELEIFNDSLLSVDKMEELCESEKDKESPLISKEISDGITKYILQGIDFNILLHDTYGMSLTDFINYDGQLGNNSICARNISNKLIGKSGYGKFGYTSIETTSGLISNDSKDANTNHIAKLVRGTGNIGKRINEENSFIGSETAFYRRFRSHDKISNENHGGKRIPDVYVVDYNLPIEKYPEELLKLLKKYNIPIVYIDTEKYRELNAEPKLEENHFERENT